MVELFIAFDDLYFAEEEIYCEINEFFHSTIYPL